MFRISPNKPLPYAKLRSEQCAVVSVVWVAGSMGEFYSMLQFYTLYLSSRSSRCIHSYSVQCETSASGWGLKG